MNCDKCSAKIVENDKHNHNGLLLCEDCYMVALSPARPCDPWAVYAAKSFSKSDAVLTKPQQNIINILKNSGGMTLEDLASKTEQTKNELQKQIATLRHMEKVKAVKMEQKKILPLVIYLQALDINSHTSGMPERQVFWHQLKLKIGAAHDR